MAREIFGTTTGNGGGVATRNLKFQRRLDDYNVMRDTLEGQSFIKSQGVVYLPKPPALVDPGNDPKELKYTFYKSFAEFPELVSQALLGVQGLVHMRPPVIELPSTLNYLNEGATPDGKSLIELWMDATREVFLMGRFGLLPEIYENRAYLCQYHAENIINWRKVKTGSGMAASLVVLYEPTEEATGDQGFGTEIINYYRVLRVEDGQYVEELWREEVKRASSDEDVSGQEMLPEFPIVPSRMGRNWSFIPFVPINATDNEYDPGQIPLLSVAQKALDIYRKSATYNRTLYLKGDPPLLRTGFEEEEAAAASTIGGGVIWNAANPDADAKYIEPTGDVIEDQRKAMLDDHEKALQAIGRLMDHRGDGVESGQALKERRAANSVTLVGVLQSVAEGFERALRNMTEVMGGNAEEVVFKPNLDFMESEMTPDDILKITQAKNEGAPLSLRTIHGRFKASGVTEMDYEAETEEIEQEDPTGVLGNDGPQDAGTAGSGGGTEEDEDPAPAASPDTDDLDGDPTR